MSDDTASLQSVSYQVSNYYTIGGPSGNYTSRSPFFNHSGTSEYALIQVTADQTSQCIVSTIPFNNDLDYAGTVSYDALTSQQLPGCVFSINSPQSIVLTPLWTPIDNARGHVYLRAKVGAGGSLYLTLIYRMKPIVAAAPTPMHPTHHQAEEQMNILRANRIAEIMEDIRTRNPIPEYDVPDFMKNDTGWRV